MFQLLTTTTIAITMTLVSVFARGELDQDINISGRVTKSGGPAISGAIVELENAGLADTTGADGRFLLKYDAPVSVNSDKNTSSQNMAAGLHKGQLSVSLSRKSEVSISIFSFTGEALSVFRRHLDVGINSVSLPEIGTGIYFCTVNSDGKEVILKTYAMGGLLYAQSPRVLSSVSLAKTSSTSAFNDILKVAKSGYQDHSMEITNPEMEEIEIELTEDIELEKFSFFVTSMKALQELSNSEDGFGGDLRFGETGPGAGLRGADKICETIAERSMKGSAVKEWRAFLSVTEDENGEQVNAIDRIGDGPWYDRSGRVFSMTKAELLNDRPAGADPIIKNDLPNEDGVPNHDPDGTGDVDNHHFLTGSNRDGELYSPTATCQDWTSLAYEAERPRIGFAWPAGGRLNWISGQDEGGCGAGFVIENRGGSTRSNPIVGSGGGYGGFYCFALNP